MQETFRDSQGFGLFRTNSLDMFLSMEKGGVREVNSKGNTARPRGTDSARVIQVIETRSLRGSGTSEDLCRIVTQYWDFDGKLLAVYDPGEKEE